jgi:hypothetical protein
MANVDAAFGLRPIRYMSGAPYNGAVNPYWIKNTSNNAVFIGDPVTITGTANTAQIEVPGAGSFIAGSLPEVLVTASGDGNPISGVVVSFAADPTALENVHRIDATERIAYVCDDPDVVFEIQGDTVATVDVTDVGNNADIIGAAGAGSTTTGLSSKELDSGTQSADASNQLILLRAVNRVGNDITAVHAQWEVQISSHTKRNAGGGADDGVLGR